MHRFNLVVDAPSLEAALAGVKGLKVVGEPEWVGRLENGRPVLHPEVPDGYQLLELVSEYYGSHSERGEGDETLCVALPEGSPAAVLSLQHGSRASNWVEELGRLPAEALVARAGDKDWTARDAFLADPFGP